jgi:hypothetical protein
VHFTPIDIILIAARWSMHLYFGAWLVLWLVWPDTRLPGMDLPPTLLLVAATMLAVEFLLLVPPLAHRTRIILPARESIFDGRSETHAA